MLLGDSGTGKTHLLIGLGLAACEQDRRVRYVTHRRPGRRARRTRRPAGAVPRGRPLRPSGPPAPRGGRLRPGRPRDAELLFQIIIEREEHASIAIGNLSQFQLTEVVYRRELRPVITTGAEVMDELFRGS